MIWDRYVKTGAVVVVVAGVIGTGFAMKHYKYRSEELSAEVATLQQQLADEQMVSNELRRNAALMAEALDHATNKKQDASNAAAEDKSKLSTLQKGEPCATTRMPDDAFNVVRQAAINANAASNVRIGRFTTGPESNSGTGSH